MNKLALRADRVNSKYAARYIANSRAKDKHATVIIEVRHFFKPALCVELTFA